MSRTAYAPDPTGASLRSQIINDSRRLDKMDSDTPAAQKARATLDGLKIRLGEAMEAASKTAEKTCADQKKKFEMLDQKRASISKKDERPETRKARFEFETQKSILEALKHRISEMPPPPEKPPSRTVRIISLATDTQTSD